MPDFSMCDYENCEKSQDCLRFLAEPDRYQSYVHEMESVCNEGNGFEYFMEVKRLKKVI